MEDVVGGAELRFAGLWCGRGQGSGVVWDGGFRSFFLLLLLLGVRVGCLQDESPPFSRIEHEIPKTSLFDMRDLNPRRLGIKVLLIPVDLFRELFQRFPQRTLRELLPVSQVRRRGRSSGCIARFLALGETD